MKRKGILLCLLAVLFSSFLVGNVSALEHHYEIDEYNIKFAILSDYDVIINANGNDNSLVYKRLGLDKDYIENYLKVHHAFFFATTQDFKKNIIFARKQDADTKKYYNLSDLDNDVVYALAQGYAQGTAREANINDYSVEKVDDITYIKLKYDLVSVQNEHLYYLKYKTFYNGYDYSVYIQQYSEITAADEEELESIIKSLEIKKIENKNKILTNYTPIIALVLFTIATIIWNIYKSKNKNKKENVEINRLNTQPKGLNEDMPKKDEAISSIPYEETLVEEENSSVQEQFESNIDQKYSDLTKLKALLDNKIITQEEFEKEKKKILK